MPEGLDELEEVEIDLLPHQWEAHEAPEAEVCLCTGLGGGKTWYGAIWIIERACEYPESVHLATANTHSQLEDVVVRKLEEAADLLGIPHRYHATKKVFYLDLGDVEAQIWCRGLENPQKALRGPEFGSWWGDEVRDYSSAAIKVCDGRIRCTKVPERKILWTTTPNGFDHIYQRFVEDAIPGIHKLVHAESTANWHLPDDYFAKLDRSYDEFLLQQEKQGKFLNLAGGNLYYTFDRAIHCNDQVQARMNKALGAKGFIAETPLILCWDNNPDPLTCEIVQEVGKETWAIDELVIRNGNIPLACEMLERKYTEHEAGIIITGDAVGTQASAVTGKSDYRTVQESLGLWYNGRIRAEVSRSNPPIIDRVNAVNRRLKGPRSEISLLLHERCKHLRLDFEQVRPKGRLRVPDKNADSERTHASDAVGYWIARKHGVTSVRTDLEALKRLAR